MDVAYNVSEGMVLKVERVQSAAKFISDEYRKMSGKDIDELKLHKLLYYAQRESLAILNELMFDAEFEGWKHGPVCKTIRSLTLSGRLNEECGKVSCDNAYIIKNVLAKYGAIESWQLSNLSHREVSWKNARAGLSLDEDGSTPLLLSDMRIDAQKIKPYDHLYDMYYDEFDDPSWYDDSKLEAII